MEERMKEKTRVIVTGATSFIGKASIKELLKAGCQVLAVVRPDSPGRAELENREGVQVVLCRLEEIGKLEIGKTGLGKPEPEQPGNGQADAWLHLGWEGAGSANRRNPQLQAKNIGYALEAVKTAAGLGCRRFLFSGSQAEYGICQGAMREDQECRPVSEYGKDKLKVCCRASELARDLGMEYIHTRIFSVYGPGDHPWSLISTCVDTFLKGGHMELGACTQQWNFLYIEEAAEILVKLLLGKAPSGVYNVAGEDTRPLREYIEELYRLCGSRGTYEFGKRPPNAEGTVSLVPDLERLRQATGFRQRISFAEGIRRMIQL